jgi:hypothetical protein
VSCWSYLSRAQGLAVFSSAAYYIRSSPLRDDLSFPSRRWASRTFSTPSIAGFEACSQCVGCGWDRPTHSFNCTRNVYSLIFLRFIYSSNFQTCLMQADFSNSAMHSKVAPYHCVKLSHIVVDISARARREQGSHAICVCDSCRAVSIVSLNVGFKRSEKMFLPTQPISITRRIVES